MMINKKGDMTPFDMKKRPCRQSPFLMPVIWGASFLMTRRFGLKIKKSGIKGLKPPYLVISTHQGFSDYYIAPLSVFPRRASYVSDMEGFAAFGRMLYRKIGCIATRRFVTDVSTLNNIKYALEKNRNIVFLFPEARHSNVGTTSVLPDNLGRLVKYLNVPVVILSVCGSYLASPFWDEEHVRTAPMKAELKLLYTSEELKGITEEEASEEIGNALKYDEYRYQYEKKIRIGYKNRAEGLSMVLYQCMECGNEFTVSDKGDELFCSNCGARWVMSEYGHLVSRETGKAIHIPDWYEWERSNAADEIKNSSYRQEYDVTVEALPNEKGFVFMGGGKLVHSIDGFQLYIPKNEERLFFSSKILYTVQTEYDYKGKGKCIVLSTRDCCYYIYCGKNDFNPTKLQLLTEEIHKALKRGGRENDRVYQNE